MAQLRHVLSGQLVTGLLPDEPPMRLCTSASTRSSTTSHASSASQTMTVDATR